MNKKLAGNNIIAVIVALGLAVIFDKPELLPWMYFLANITYLLEDIYRLLEKRND